MSDPITEIYQESIRLIHKFFPESRSYLNEANGFSFNNVLMSMDNGNLNKDYSCDPFQTPAEPNLGLLNKGGFTGSYSIIIERLLDHSKFSPKGRCVVIPDLADKPYWKNASDKPCLLYTSPSPRDA